MKASLLRESRTQWDVAIYGESGSGKTTWAARSPEPFVILTEPQGLDSIVDANPDADVEIAADYPRLAVILAALAAGKVVGTGASARYVFDLDGTERRIASVILDSFTDVQDMISYHITGGKPANITQQQWGELEVICRRVLKCLRSLPTVNKVVLFLSSESIDDLQVRRIIPAIVGSTRNKIGQYFNVFGFAQKQVVDGVQTHVIDFRLSNRYVTKAPRRWPNRIVSRLERPGDTTLGSLSLALLGPNVPHGPGDNAKFVAINTIPVSESDETDSPAVEAAPSTTTTRRPRKGVTT